MAVTEGADATLRPARLGALAHLLVRVLLVVAVAVACFPGIFGRPLASLCLAAGGVLVSVAVTLAPHRDAATVHDRQLDHILAVGTGLAVVWVGRTWSPTDPVVAVVCSGGLAIVLALLLVGTRTVSRLWPAALAWFGAALDPVPGGLVVLILVVAALVRAGRRRARQLELSTAELGVPGGIRGLLPACAATLGAAALGWGLLG